MLEDYITIAPVEFVDEHDAKRCMETASAAICRRVRGAREHDFYWNRQGVTDHVRMAIPGALVSALTMKSALGAAREGLIAAGYKASDIEIVDGGKAVSRSYS
jgi:hypothetical protein